MNQRFGISDGVSLTEAWLTVAVVVLWLLLIGIEARKRRAPLVMLVSGVVAALGITGAILRPTRVTTRGSELYPKVTVLVDRSWRLALPEAGKTRDDVAIAAARQLKNQLREARVEVLGFGEGVPRPLDLQNPAGPRPTDSDLGAALRALAAAPGERAKAVVVVSDGRFASPTEDASPDALRALGERLGAPIHTIRVSELEPPDASIRKVGTAGAAVAHEKSALRLEIGCSGGLACDEVPVKVEELLHGEAPAVLAQGVAKVQGGSATLELPFTLDRAGRRLVRISIEPPDGDRVPENDSRLLTFDVSRERVRVLHVAGRPTYDVRSLRMWLKADESIDLIAFFILRTTSDSTQTSDDSELSLIPFPVDELFTEHLPSFDAVILQDIDAVEYKLARHLPALARYVRAGGGLIMVGGPSAFLGGGYAGSPLADVLPVALPERGAAFDTAPFEPRTTEAGRAAPVLRGVRDLLGERVPRMTGTSLVGAARPSSIVLWEHPERRAGEGAMPVLALGEAGDGRAIALSVDGSHLLQWSELAEQAAGRAHGALWEGLVGWLMRDPRYEAARIELLNECRAGAPTSISVTRLPGAAADVRVTIERLGSAEKALRETTARLDASTEETTVSLGPLAEGGYSALVRVGGAPPSRFDFACERGGAAFADSRPDKARLERLSRETRGTTLNASEVAKLEAPKKTRVDSEVREKPLLPSWLWGLLAASGLGAHWYTRRRAGLV